MPWKEARKETMREEFVKRVLSKEKSKSALCREYGISRPTGDKWIERYLSGETLADRSRAPATQRQQTDQSIEAEIVAYRKKYPAFGAMKIQRIMQDEGKTGLPSVRTINNIFQRNRLITKEASLAATPYQRYERDLPNDLWQGDFKGNFCLKDGVRCHPLNIIDDHSRFNLCSHPLPGETYEEVMPVIIHLFKEYGMPKCFLCDNGPPWGTSQTVGFTHFEVRLMELGVLTLHGRPNHPQTQGKEESFNRAMTRELLKYQIPENMADAERLFNEYRDLYNNKRPHHALGLDTPSAHYQKSTRKMPEKIEAWEYGSEYEIRRVKETGYFNYRGQGYFLSEAFGGKEIAIRESHIPGQVTLLFRQFRIARIDVEKRVFTLRRAYLLTGDPRG